MWFSRIKSQNLKLYLRGVRILEEKQQKRYLKFGYFLVFYLSFVEFYRTFFQEEWERKTWIPKFVLHSRREHFINTEYYRLKSGLPTTFSMSNYDFESKMVYHMDTNGNHRYEKIVLPPYTYGELSSPSSIEQFYKFSVYNMNKTARNDLDNYLRFKTVTLGDWVTAVYYKFNVYTHSFDPFFYKPEFLYEKDRDMLLLNLQTDNKPDTILRILSYTAEKIQSFTLSSTK